MGEKCTQNGMQLKAAGKKAHTENNRRGMAVWGRARVRERTFNGGFDMQFLFLSEFAWLPVLASALPLPPLTSSSCAHFLIVLLMIASPSPLAHRRPAALPLSPFERLFPAVSTLRHICT